MLKPQNYISFLYEHEQQRLIITVPTLPPPHLHFQKNQGVQIENETLLMISIKTSHSTIVQLCWWSNERSVQTGL